MPFDGLFYGKYEGVLQGASGECGLACLATICGLHGRHLDFDALRRTHDPSQRGTSLRWLIQVATEIGLSPRAIRFEMEYLPQLQLPCVLHWEANHFVVLRKIKGKWIFLLDPARGAVRIAIADAARSLTGVALELLPGQQFERGGRPEDLSLRQVFPDLPHLIVSLLGTVAITIGVESVALASPMLLRWLVDEAVAGTDRLALPVFALLSIGLLVSGALFGLLQAWSILYVGSTFSLRWSTSVFGHLIRLPIDYFHRRYVADVVSRMQSVTVAQGILTSSFVSSVLDLLFVIAATALMFLFGGRLAIITLSGVILYVVLRLFSASALGVALERLLKYQVAQSGHLLETVRGIQALKLADKWESRMRGWWSASVDAINAATDRERINIAIRLSGALLFGAERLAVLAFGALEVINRQMSLGALLAFIAIKDMFTGRVAGLTDRIADYKNLRVHTRRVADIVLSPIECTDRTANTTSLNEPPAVEFRDVHFRYAKSDPWVLRGLSFSILSGQTLGIAGPSGAGKSSILKLLLGIHSPVLGEIFINGVELKEFGVERLREIAAVVMQDDQLFSGSILENVCFFDDQPDIERCQLATRLASFDEDVARIPARYNTQIGDMGQILSGGQRQRLLLARALYRKPRLLLLDEATSHIDPERESVINGNLKLMGCTRIMSAHRPSTLLLADTVIRISQET